MQIRTVKLLEEKLVTGFNAIAAMWDLASFS